MGLRFYAGNSGTGKSYTMYQHVLDEAQKYPMRQYIVLVPEQFTMQTQKDLVKMSPSGGIWNIDVLSFERLAYRVFSQTGGGNLPVLDEIGKMFVVRRVAEEEKDELLIMKNYLSKAGYINEVKSMISEFVQYDVSQQRLEELMEANQDRQQLHVRLHDMKVIYGGFLDFLKERYITSEELLDVLCRVVHKSRFLRDAVLVLDGFTGFTPVQKKLLEELMKLCSGIWTAVTYDTSMPLKDNLPDYHLFHMSAKLMCDMKQMARNAGMEMEEAVVLPHVKNVRFEHNPPMQALEGGLFRSRHACYDKEQEQVQIHVCRNPAEEVSFAAEEIRRLVMKGDIRYRDIAIVTGDLAGYGDYVERIFPEYGISFFSDYKRDAMANPAVACVRALLDCAISDFTYESVCRLWRCGLMPMEQETADRMQNYILACGIRGKKRYEEPWTRCTGTVTEDELENLNVVREQFIQPLLQFATNIRSKRTTVKEKTHVLTEVMEAYCMNQQLEQYAASFEEEGRAALAREYGQIYERIMEVLERLCELLGEEKMDGRQYAKLLDAGFAELKVGVVPPGIDEVTVADIERSRLKNIRILFFLGVNDGVIPKGTSGAGILSELERDCLKEQGVELAPGREEQYYTQRFYLYFNMTRPKEQLYMTYSKVDAQGNALNPSYLIRTVMGIFPKIHIQDEEERRACASSIAAPVQAMDYIVKHYKGQRDDVFYGLYHWFAEKESYSRVLQSLRHASGAGRGADRIHSALAKALYGNELAGSVTRLERYAACAYAHFLAYGIGVKEREEYGFRGLDFGNILHLVLDKYADRLKQKGILWTQSVGEEQGQLVDTCVDEVIMQYDNTVLFYSARDRYRVTRIKRIARRTVWALTKQLEAGEFVPSGYELSFRNTEPLWENTADSSRFDLRGRIDRMDVCETDGKLYVKVMDYKTGRKEFKLLHVYYGVQLQLVAYLQAAIQFEKKIYREKEVIPAGVLYYRVDDPLVEAAGEDVEESILEALKVDGVLSDEDEVLGALDRNLLQKSAYKSPVVPVAVKKDGMLASASRTLNREQFDTMMEYTHGRMKQMGRDILEGDIRMNPYTDGQQHACSYCPYHEICVQKQRGNDIEKRSFHKWDETEIYLRMKEGKLPEDE